MLIIEITSVLWITIQIEIEIDPLKDNTAREVIHTLKRQFSRHGIPNTLMSDNGPPFNSNEFQQFATNYDMEHVTSSPHYPQ